MGRYFVKRKEYDALVGELQKLQVDFSVLKNDYTDISDINMKLSNKVNCLNDDRNQLKEKISNLKVDVDMKNIALNSMLNKNIELANRIDNFKINTFRSIQVNIKNRKSFRVRNKQNKKLNNDVIQHLVNIAFEK